MQHLLIILALFGATSGFSGKFVRCEEPHRPSNTIAYRLAGTWTVNQALSYRANAPC
jgi:hypothetical protein